MTSCTALRTTTLQAMWIKALLFVTVHTPESNLGIVWLAKAAVRVLVR